MQNLKCHCVDTRLEAKEMQTLLGFKSGHQSCLDKTSRWSIPWDACMSANKTCCWHIDFSFLSHPFAFYSKVLVYKRWPLKVVMFINNSKNFQTLPYGLQTISVSSGWCAWWCGWRRGLYSVQDVQPLWPAAVMLCRCAVKTQAPVDLASSWKGQRFFRSRSSLWSVGVRTWISQEWVAMQRW